VSRHRRLGDPELSVNNLANRLSRLFAAGQQLQYPAADRIPENVERVHPQIVSGQAYIS
jgi:hypothetical protein